MISDDKYVGWIYMILNKVNGKIYVGQTYDKLGYKARWGKHKSKLRGNYHDNSHLQSAWNKYGEDNFEFILLHELEFNNEENMKRELNIIEIYYIYEWDLLNDEFGYNISKGGNTGSSYIGEDHPMYGKTHLKKSKEKMSKNHANVEGVKNPRAKQIKMLDKDTKELIKIFDCIADANEFLGKDRNAYSIYSCLRGKYSTAYGYSWEYVDDIKRGNYNNKRKVAKIDINTNEIIRVYDTIAEANKDITGNRRSSGISSCINGKQYTAFGFKWKVIEEDKTIIMIDKDNFNILNIFNNAKEANNFIGKSYCDDNILSCVRGERETAWGYKWRSIDEEYNIKYTKYDNKYIIKIAMTNKDTGEIIKIFSSRVEASKYLNVNHCTQIDRSLKNSKYTAYGYRWIKVKVDNFNNVTDII